MRETKKQLNVEKVFGCSCEWLLLIAQKKGVVDFKQETDKK